MTQAYEPAGGTNARRVARMPRHREVILDILREGHHHEHVHGIVQVEVTEVRARMQALVARGLPPPSMTAFIVHGTARAVATFPQVHAVRTGRSLTEFEDMDVSTIVERMLPDGTQVPASMIMRAANRAPLRAIHDQLRAAQEAELRGITLANDRLSRQANILARLPRPLRAVVWWLLRRSPVLRKRMIGTINVTSVGMFGELGVTGWAVISGPWPLIVTVGSISRVLRPGADGEPREAEMLNLVVAIDHAVVDGGPAARFIAHLIDTLEAGAGLDAFEASAVGG
ncbi:2-oxo acid dehydrogenase subunit E2 [Pararhodobacter sp.]|uniref:2-oxo acid dehydrogenase subunit E2 n=1 Tax=Pararhodobacter sp. TaxID=2127056 RepID=UPI002AFE293F|nr:2-oxo acid dehydrogenase subunit E2 [Pararhodobacter sp.]